MDTARNPARMNDQFDRYQISLAFLSSSVLRVMTDGVATSLRTLVTGSEAANGIYFDGVRLVNNDGMSEASFHVAQFEVDRRYDVTPIGKPVFGEICIHLLDENDQEVADGEKGEICFDNPFFRGYIHMPEETEKVFRNSVLQRYIDEGIRALNRMEEASLDGKAISQDTLMRLIRDNEDTEYGKKYGFREIRTYADYAAKVPLSEYEDYEQYIERMLCFGEKNLITTSDVVYYAHTSGTTGSSKMIPCTQRALDILFTTVFQRVFGLYETTCRSTSGTGMPACLDINLMESRVGYTPNGKAHGAISETLNIPEDAACCNALPETIIFPVAEFDRRHVKMLYALRERHLSFLMYTFSPTLYDMITYVRHHWQMLCDDIEAGRICRDVAVDPKLRKILEAELTPDPRRAAEIRAIMAVHQDDAFVPLLWPDLKLIAMVGTATFAPYIDKLRQSLGSEIAVDYLGYVCAEGTIGVPLP